VEATGIFNWPGVHRAISDHLDRRANYGYHLWGLLMLFLWRKRWSVGL
jgi:asparagine synthase (glutamine-hydrolysing)